MAHGGRRRTPRPRPVRGVLARHGWLWLLGVAVVLLVVGVAAAVAIDADTDPNPTVSALAGFALLVGVALIVVGLPVRALVVRTRRQEWADALLPVPPDRVGVETAEPPVLTPAQLRRRDLLRRVAVVGIYAVGVAIAVFVGVLGVVRVVDGVHTQRLQHSSGTVHLRATLERDTHVHHGRRTTYSDRVSYVVHGRSERGVDVATDRARHAGDTVAILVDPDDPRAPIAASDDGWGDLVGGGFLLLALVLAAGSLVAARRRRGRERHRRKRASTRG